MKLTVKKEVDLFGFRTIKPSDYWTFGLSELRTIGPSDYWTFGLSGLRTIGPSDYWTFGLSDLRTIGPSDYRTFGLSGLRTIGPSDYRTVTMSLRDVVIHITCLHWWHFLYEMDIWLKTRSCRKTKAGQSELGLCKLYVVIFPTQRVHRKNSKIHRDVFVFTRQELLLMKYSR